MPAYLPGLFIFRLCCPSVRCCTLVLAIAVLLWTVLMYEEDLSRSGISAVQNHGAAATIPKLAWWELRTLAFCQLGQRDLFGFLHVFENPHGSLRLSSTGKKFRKGSRHRRRRTRHHHCHCPLGTGLSCGGSCWPGFSWAGIAFQKVQRGKTWPPE